MHLFHKFIFGTKLYMFRTVPLSETCTVSCSSILVLLESCPQSCMTYTIAECTVKELLMMDKGTVRNM